MHDVVIVGARPAGAATAMLLARAGLDVLVVDRSQYGRDTLSTHALMRGAVLQLTRWGLIDAVIAAETPPIRHTIFHYEHGTSAVSIKSAAHVDALCAPRRTVLDPILVDAARVAGADVRFGTTVTQVLKDRDGRVAGVVARQPDGTTFDAHAPLVVGADGMSSFVASAIGAPFIRRGRHASDIAYGYWTGLEVRGYEWFYRPRLTAGFIPTNHGEVCVFVGAPRGSLPPGSYLSALAAAGPDAHDRLAVAAAPARVQRFGGIPGFIRRAVGPGWALVGDAGYFKDPLSTHGLTDALRDAELLARAVLRGNLDEYQLQRDALSRQLFSVVDDLASYDWDEPGVRRLLLALNSCMADEVEALLGLGESSADIAASPAW